MLVITTSSLTSGGFELLEQLEETEKRLKAGKIGGDVITLQGRSTVSSTWRVGWMVHNVASHRVNLY